MSVEGHLIEFRLASENLQKAAKQAAKEREVKKTKAAVQKPSEKSIRETGR